MFDALSTSSDSDSYTWRQRVGLVAGPAALLAVLVLEPPSGLDAAGWHTAGIAGLMAIWWITEALPIPATALVPVVGLPLLGIGSMADATTPYANPLIFLFLGGFLIALAMQRWDLHRRIALRIIATVGTGPKALIAGFMLACAFLSMWISNTATAMMMLPIGTSVVALARSNEDTSAAQTHAFAVALMLSIAYACNIGGMGTLIGTPPNALLAGFVNESYNIDIGFAQWMGIGLPMVVVGLPLAYRLLTRVLFRVDAKAIAGGTDLVQRRLADLGSMTHPERMVAAVFSSVALLWMTRPLLEAWVPGLTDAGIAMAGGLVLFVLPVDWRAGTFVLDWESAEQLPWGVLILFGGGLSLAQAIESTGLATWIGEALGVIGSWPLLLVVVLVTAAIIGLTEITSNTATAAAFLPIMASVAVGIGENPFLLAVPVALAASSAFMLPVATPPNAIVFGSGDVSIPQMARAGVTLNLLFVVLIALVTYTLGPLVLGIELGTLPGWAG
ncbi:MAG: DASS family sodium-coupled anion symporter [Longimonas sp.]|uniref:SLC13 family permease n=1 Tax=Longimonas sp. TaxID=2039626 RepID=UPI003976BDCD